MSNQSRATHSGTCQACGSLQKLPNGKLAKHGYTTKWGFFSGICAGAGKLPYELSCTYIQQCIDNVTAQKAETTVERDALLIPATEPKGWVRHSTYSRQNGSSSSKWELVEILCESHTLDSGHNYFTFTYQMPVEVKARGWDDVTGQPVPAVTEPRSFKCCEYSTAQNALEAATALNAQYARTFTQRISEMSQYIVWQQERVTNWKLAALTPVSGGK